ncbi:MAG: hypothetical protein EOO27_27355 [Comamonadaceae bacterium]|nr:MAG: hypothetical protein EOO27_27355 [Comamonadaceae bacterium]
MPFVYTCLSPCHLRTCCIATLLCLGACGGGGADDAVRTAPSSSSYVGRCQLPASSPGALVLPAPTGEHCIGKARFQLVDGARAETHSADKSDRRELSVTVWYPTAATAEGRRADYWLPMVAALVKAQMSVPLTAPDVQTNARAATAMEPGRIYPVVIFSPGYGMVVETYSALMEDLASHGRIVVAIDHPYISGATPMANGQVVQALAGPAADQRLPAFLDEAVATLVADQRFVLDWLQGPDTGVLGGHLDLGHTGLVGHSIGGAAAIQTARADQRVKAGLDIDGTVYGSIAGLWQKPLMFLLGSDHVGDLTIEMVLRLAAGPTRSVTVQDAGHLDFSDLKWLLSFYVPGLSPSALAAQGLGPVEASRALQITRRETLSFLQQSVGP